MKHIISCSDGTWNKAVTEPVTLVRTNNKTKITSSPQQPEKNLDTNVVKMYNSICATGKDKATGQPVPQVKIYDQGVGTGYTLKDRLLGGATGAGLDKNIKDVYQFFMLNYQPGDKLFFFGFSRGAYTARSLTGFIRNCGILKPENIGLVDKAYSLYRDRNSYTHPESDLMKSFRAAYAVKDETGSHVVPIHFIGVWDTVGALGIPLSAWKMFNQRKYQFHDVKLSSHVCHAYQALAIDERRSLFGPTLWEKSDTVKADPNHHQHKQMEQRWFPGVHSNVGGGYDDCGLSNIALEWMIRKAEGAGLCFNEPPLVTARPQDKGDVMNSLSFFYRLSGAKWRTVQQEAETSNQTIDESVLERWKDGQRRYRPKNLNDWANGL